MTEGAKGLRSFAWRDTLDLNAGAQLPDRKLQQAGQSTLTNNLLAFDNLEAGKCIGC